MFTQKRYYLDYAAATPVSLAVERAMRPYWSKQYANPHSIHQSGVVAHQVVNQCEKKIRQVCHMGTGDGVVWTSGGTESNHLVIDYAIDQWKKSSPGEPYTVIISSVEHPSVVDYLESKSDPSLSVEYIPVDTLGVIDLRFLETRLLKNSHVALVSCVFQNSEVGATQPIKELARLIKKHLPQTLVHTDASQGMMYHQCNFSDWGVDMVTLCGQKIHGPKGSGALLIEKGIEISREGTPAVPLIVGMTKALAQVQKNVNSNKQKIVDLRKFLFQKLDECGVEYVVNGNKKELSLIINLSFPSDDRDSEQLVITFDQVGLEVSSKSACMGSQAEDSRVLSAMGLHPKNSIRLCLHHSMKKKDLERIAGRIQRVLR